MSDIVSAAGDVHRPLAGITRVRPTAHRQPWAEEEDAALRRMLAEGQLIAPVARALGRTQEGVRNRANLLGLAVRSSPGQGRRKLA